MVLEWLQAEMETQNEQILQQLQRAILAEWPREKAYVPSNLKAYWDYQDEITFTTLKSFCLF